MRRIVHLSDPHFGRIDERLLPPLTGLCHALAPHLLVVSGDLTQRARSAQFAAARAFLDALPHPQVVVPGNHDVPLHNPFARFLGPLDQFRRFISEDTEPGFVDEEIAVFGLNSARALTIKGGRINPRQVARLRERLAAVPAGATRIVVTHHPFDLPPALPREQVVRGARGFVEALTASGADLILSGHFHISHAGRTTQRYRFAGNTALLILAGTATSTRRRGEPNSFNVIEIDRPRLAVRRFAWDEDTANFRESHVQGFTLGTQGWIPEAPQEPPNRGRPC